MNASQHDPERILIFEPHPDDVAFQIGGSVAKWVSQGREVFVCTVTNGSSSTFNPAVTREQITETLMAEHVRALSRLGVDADHYIQWDYDDCCVDPGATHTDLRPRMMELIRRIRPVTVVTLDPTHNMMDENPDHRATALCAFESAALAATHTLYPGQLSQDVQPHFVSRVLFYMSEFPTVFVNIEGAPLDAKLAAGLEYASQLELLATDARRRLAGLGAHLPLFDMPPGDIWRMMCRQIAEDMAAECVAWDPARDIQFAEGLRMQYLGIVDKIKDFLDIPESLRLD
jgi:LmbE family N-acetylglucosaminyl deacetylase